jgi:hypothetical protein
MPTNCLNSAIVGALVIVLLLIIYKVFIQRTSEYQGPGHGNAGKPPWATPSAGIEYQGPGHGNAGKPPWATPSAGIEHACGCGVEHLWDGGISLQSLAYPDQTTMQNIDTTDFNSKSMAFYLQRPY